MLFGALLNTPQSCFTECETTHKAEIAFVVDASSSVTTANWPVVLSFISNVVGSFPMAADQVGAF